MQITISDSLRAKASNTALGIITARVKCMEENAALKEEMDALCRQYQETFQIADLSGLSPIADTRAAYRSFGKEPSRYRVSSEALLRRILQGKGLYYINTIVDTGNLVSIYSKFGVCCFDREKITGPVCFDIAEEGDSYQSIGKGILNISHLPVFKDSMGSFGSPTSDSARTKITLETRELLLVIVSFSGRENLEQLLLFSARRLEKYCQATEIETSIL